MKIRIFPKFIFKKERNISNIWRCETIITLFNFIKIKYTKDKIKGKNNKIYVRKTLRGGGIQLVATKKIEGAYLKITGDNNVIIFDESAIFSNATLYIRGNNNKIEFKNGVKISSSVFDLGTNSENRNICIGENNYLLEARLHCWGDNVNFELGDNCLLSNKITIITSDGHKIMDTQTNEIINAPKSMKIGKGCWIGKNVVICKNVTIPNNCIIGIGSVVTKSFTKSNVAIAGNPAKIVKENVKYVR